jgi:hypothetical protein
MNTIIKLLAIIALLVFIGIPLLPILGFGALSIGAVLATLWEIRMDLLNLLKWGLIFIAGWYSIKYSIKYGIKGIIYLDNIHWDNTKLDWWNKAKANMETLPGGKMFSAIVYDTDALDKLCVMSRNDFLKWHKDYIEKKNEWLDQMDDDEYDKLVASYEPKPITCEYTI